MLLCSKGMVTVMCTTTISTLTLDCMLRDPLIQMMMRSDKVSEQDHSDLLYRVQNSLIQRASLADAAIKPSAWALEAQA